MQDCFWEYKIVFPYHNNAIYNSFHFWYKKMFQSEVCQVLFEFLV